ncbi:GNAT family N-acetyltransferase [Rubrimonas cliftonensis]|uniref:Ribosomal protein S18 acetylase RimI n=1 Tax=Rubrimonas cliftonensis TaxID=89524 RepID=A0A1H4C570_9RHOB|nr:GNAT family N-acetyltransferase [Rubrimonas cliftonensis]SEA55516.1 Ribosomal protein S18 acetylase RimI [Rubrimonas cliftonensis]
MTGRPHRLRAATDADRPALAALQVAGWRDAYAALIPADYLAGAFAGDVEQRWRDLEIGPDDVVLAAEAPDGALDGFITVWSRATPYIDNLHVRPGLRGGGVGRRLMAEAARRLAAQGRDAVELTVAVRNLRARAFYARLGGVEGEETRRPSFGAVIFHCLPVRWTSLAPLVAADAA